MNWYKKADAYGRPPAPLMTLATVKEPFQITLEDEKSGKVRIPWSLKRMFGDTPISFHQGDEVATWKSEGFWNVVHLERLKGRDSSPVQISEDLAKMYLQSERGEDGKPVQSNNPEKLIQFSEAKNHYKGESDTTGTHYINLVMQETSKKLDAVAHKYNMDSQTLAIDPTFPRALKYLLNPASLKRSIVESYNMAVNNPWSRRDLIGTLLMYTTRDIQAVEEFIKAKVGQSQAQLRRKQKEEQAKRQGMVVCPRCGGEGGSSAWDATGWDCYECGGSGMVPPKAGM